MTRYLLAGGGTAGHVNPLLAVADRLSAVHPDSEVLVLGTLEGLEARLVPQRGYELVTIARVVFPRRPNAAALRFPRAFRDSVADIRRIIVERKIDALVGFGGYVSGPAYVAAWREKIPLVVHEANTRPGIANRLGAVLTTHVGTAFRRTRLLHSRLVGMPLRREIEELDRAASRTEAIRAFGLDPRKPVLLITGGSQGAMAINETIWKAAASVLGAGWQILHIAGARWERLNSDLVGYQILQYSDRMDLALAAADFAVARAGAATVSEFSALGVPAAYVPLPIGNGEQRLNAQDSVDAGGAIVVANADFTPAWVDHSLVPLLEDRAAVAAMAARALSVGVLDGSDRMVDLIAEAIALPPSARRVR
ncbi:UDP-N-acetylglucosamine--N-acetylmuramyl-(pentapeptide) pyrophosphoryl-undecaprenol N-acetylglucosamine transferase [Lacisediminihabitans changchengi]|uniref:UDP-N-acetylglucosamine--N-acetylmuramyl-(pentapeptide) pyrophosphoryl-undecaprenol N-acetylglucosamine transferase n=1 Tax=Lacisediminihabitans changchengi TaxID=2787634 RepID=A0A934SML1_9MICO|nr:UDP-N-acetylglucosamine--N-acetylmuramyl-(pentapeptide) pyrophosphoryl-undecaprenol N-acetylglucosamine transferase [Lacisediminihabitans changchengi]MBK4347757.1 UDP-N-acetylglucosamine--N-acetylmuramyl-(pentapeptide) pyrophosphoryl-undecaprenol N-acetylglucosamine transferase [Lacisediminihabitans changchengi]